MVTRVGGVEVRNFLEKLVARQLGTSQEKVRMDILLKDLGCSEADLRAMSISIEHQFGVWIDVDDPDCIPPFECLYLNDICDKVESVLMVRAQHQRI